MIKMISQKDFWKKKRKIIQKSQLIDTPCKINLCINTVFEKQ